MQSYRDIDVAIYSKNQTLNYIAKLSAKLELKLGIPIDIIPLTELPPNFKWQILTKGIILIEKQPRLYEALLNLTQDEIKHEEHKYQNNTKK